MSIHRKGVEQHGDSTRQPGSRASKLASVNPAPYRAFNRYGDDKRIAFGRNHYNS